MRPGALVLAGVISGALAGCDGPTPTDPAGFGTHVLIVPVERLYSAGDIVTLRLTNLGTRSISMGACFSALYREVSEGSWAEAFTFALPCPDLLIEVDGYGLRTVQAGLPSNLPAGRYRLLKLFSVIVDGSAVPERELSAPFQVD